MTASSPPAIRRWNGFTNDIKHIVSRDPSVIKVKVLERSQGKHKVAMISAQVGGTFILQPVGQACFFGDGAETPYDFTSLELKHSYGDWKDDLASAMSIPVEGVVMVGKVAAPAPAAAGGEEDHEM